MTTAAIAEGPAPEPAPALPGARGGRLAEPLLALTVAVVIAAAGLPVGLLWRLVAPQVEFVMTGQGAMSVQTEPEGFVADDGWYLIITFVVGALAALLVWVTVPHRRGPVMLLGLAVGCVAGGVLTAWIGHRIGYAHYLQLGEHAKVGTHFFRPPSVRAAKVGLWFGFLPRVQGAVLVEAVVAVVTYLVLAAFHLEPDLREGAGDEPLWAGPDAGADHLGAQSADRGYAADQPYGAEPDGAVSWAPTESTAPSASPAPPGSDPAAPPRD